MKLLLLLSLLSAVSSAFAAPKIALAPPWLKEDLVAKESTAIVHGERYRRLEVDGNVYYLKFQQPNGPQKEKGFGRELLDCLKASLAADPGNARLGAEVKITKVSSLYLTALNRDCETYKLAARDFEAGVKIRPSKDSELDFGIRPNPKAGLELSPTFRMSF